MSIPTHLSAPHQTSQFPRIRINTATMRSVLMWQARGTWGERNGKYGECLISLRGWTPLVCHPYPPEPLLPLAIALELSNLAPRTAKHNGAEKALPMQVYSLSDPLYKLSLWRVELNSRWNFVAIVYRNWATFDFVFQPPSWISDFQFDPTVCLMVPLKSLPLKI